MLTPRDLPEVRALLDRDPVRHCFVASRIEASGLDPWRSGGEMWGWEEEGRLVSALYQGANLVPIESTPAAREAFAARCRRLGRRCSSIVGPTHDVMALWELVEPAWGPARAIREDQPLLALQGPPAVPSDPLVRRVEMSELDVLLPACVAMFTEEVGVSPLAAGGTEAYRARVAELVHSGRAFARFEGGKVLFKAEVGAVSRRACQVQGVWVDPEFRGRGHSISGMASVVELARDIAPICSLYVNDFNTPARAAYRAVGFRQVGTFTTVLF